jgi:hypothetical protein
MAASVFFVRPNMSPAFVVEPVDGHARSGDEYEKAMLGYFNDF